MDAAPNFCQGFEQLRSAMLPTLPIAVLEEVFTNVPARELVCVCRLVCRQWKELVDSTSLWRDRCRREGYEPRNASNPLKDWRQFYFLCKRRRNLLKNPRAEEEDFDGWNIVKNGGDGWNVENVSREYPFPDRAVRKHFATSYDFCIKSQLIDLVKEGYGAAFMDEVQPDVIASEWYSPCQDCGCVYQFCVELLDQNKMVIQKFCPSPLSFHYPNVMNWRQIKHVFRDYGPGVRFIRFTHGGKDTRFWAGWYGIRITNSSVEISPSGDA